MKPDQLLRSILPEVLIDNFDIDRFEKSESRSKRAFPTTIWPICCLKPNFDAVALVSLIFLCVNL